MGQYYFPISIDNKEFVYSHDYGNGLKLMEHSWIGNDFVNVVENLIAEGGAWHGHKIVWAGDYADEEPGKSENLYGLIAGDDANKLKPTKKRKNYRYVVNMDTKEFVDTKKIPLSDVYVDNDGKEWPYTMHPLPILTCEGNGRGGGDFHKDDDLVGKWARNRVTVATRKPKGYKEIEFNLFEGDKPAELKSETVNS